MSEAKKWKLQGSYFETCNCETACPCVWLQAPTEGDCKLLVAWHIESGYLENQTLNNLNVALACYAPDNMKEGNWQAALYIDEQADDVQFEAITQIFSGQQGGHLAILMSFVSDVLGTKKVKIDYQEDENKRFMSIPGIAQAEIEGIQGITGLSRVLATHLYASSVATLLQLLNPDNISIRILIRTGSLVIVTAIILILFISHEYCKFSACSQSSYPAHCHCPICLEPAYLSALANAHFTNVTNVDASQHSLAVANQ